jgi:hypothetical protein
LPLVVTLPHDLNSRVQIHPEVIYGLLFETVWATLSTFGTDPKRLDGQLGMTSVLHTWGQTLSQHVHLHCLVPGGAFSTQGDWHPAKSTYLFPVRALSRHIRGGFVSRLRQQLRDGKLPRLENPAQIDAMLGTLMATDWVIYSKPCLTHTETVVDYLGRYSHRIALSDARILSLDENQVRLDYKDYRDGNRHKVLALPGEELLRRFLLHVLPKGFMRIRHFGFLANRCRAERLGQIRAAIDIAQQQPAATADAESPAPFDGYPCPLCRRGRLRVTAFLVPKRFDGGGRLKPDHPKSTDPQPILRQAPSGLGMRSCRYQEMPKIRTKIAHSKRQKPPNVTRRSEIDHPSIPPPLSQMPDPRLHSPLI